jgi:hypothetical protein
MYKILARKIKTSFSVCYFALKSIKKWLRYDKKKVIPENLKVEILDYCSFIAFGPYI